MLLAVHLIFRIMAAVGRAGETDAVQDNIYDNSAKEITPEKVRAALAVIIESNFNLVDDLLKDANYDTGQTLQQKLDSNPGVLLNSESSVIPVQSATEGAFYNGDANATFQVTSKGVDALYLTVSFPNLGTTSYVPFISWEINGTWHTSNAVFCSWSNKTATSIRVYLQRVYDSPSGRVHVTLIKV